MRMTMRIQLECPKCGSRMEGMPPNPEETGHNKARFICTGCGWEKVDRSRKKAD